MPITSRWLFSLFFFPFALTFGTPQSGFAQSGVKKIFLTKTQEYEVGTKSLNLPPGTLLSIYRETEHGHYCQFGGVLFWVYQKNSVAYPEAMEYFSELISQQPNLPDGYRGRSTLKKESGDIPGSLADLDKSIELSKTLEPSDFHNRGILHRELLSHEKALADFKTALRLSSKSYFRVLTLYQRGLVHLDQNKVDEAMADFDEAITLGPKFCDAFRMKAWVMATHPMEKYRDASKALIHANKAFELSPEINEACWETLAVAYAEAGDFFEAIRTINKACSHSGKKTKTQIAMLEKFQEKKAFRQTGTTNQQQVSMVKP